MQGLKKSIAFFQEEKYRNLPYGTIYYVAGTASSENNDFVLAQIESLEEYINQDPSNWVTCHIEYLDKNNSLFTPQRYAALYSAMLPTDDSQGYNFFVATLQNCRPEQMKFAFSSYFRTLQQMFDEILDDGSYNPSHLENTMLWDTAEHVRFSVSKDISGSTHKASVEEWESAIHANYPSAHEEACEEMLPHLDKPSRLEITPNTYDILLPDYNREFHFGAQVKALYILFLNHPEGIRIKEIADYKEEFTRIYFRVTNWGDVEQLR